MSGEEAPARTSRKAGVIIILVMGVIFVLLLFALMFAGSRRPPAPELSRSYYVIAPKLKIRTQPLATAPVLSTVDREGKVEIVEEAGIWVKVKATDGIVGWTERVNIAGQKEYGRRMARTRAILKLPPLEGFVTQRTALYSGPGPYYPVVGQLPTETKIKVYTRDHDFYAIDYAGTIAYAAVDAVELAPQAQEEIAVALGGEITDVSPVPVTATTAEETTTPAPPISEWIPKTVEPDPIGVYPAVPPGGTQPQVVSRVSPVYSRQARDKGIEGTVMIRAIVRKDGRVDEVEILRDLPFGLGESARGAVRRWRFLPATYNGEPIDVYYTVTVRFSLKAGG